MIGGEDDRQARRYLSQSQHTRSLVRHARARAASVIAAVAATGDQLAAILDQMAEQRPHRAAVLRARSRDARSQAARQRQLADQPLDRGCADSPGVARPGLPWAVVPPDEAA